ncbi:uncharacterized protein LOC120334329 [Styela clava]|uniref:uncharacterized protein LOC120334329 n=1 Tax=Styela clava TaxID=7725 RepID=UPI001939DC3D|nr:uncharacterized protein LOC120334329 [Styela clava]
MEVAVFCIVLACVTAGWAWPPIGPKDLSLPVPPPCKLKIPPWKNPELCSEEKKSKCFPRTCIFTITKGYIYKNGKKKEVKIARTEKIKVVECRDYLDKCDAKFLFSCRCQHMGKKIFKFLYVAKKIKGRWKSIRTLVQVNIPDGCICASPLIVEID